MTNCTSVIQISANLVRELFALKALVALNWMHLRVNLICIFVQKNAITARCSLWKNFTGNFAVFNVYK